MTAGEFAGYVASVLVFMAFSMKTMVPLRIVGILSNLAFIAYSTLEGLVPVFLLHAALLPLNILRLRQILQLVSDVGQAAHAEVSLEALLPLMGRRRVKAGVTLFRKGDPSGDMFYIKDGVVVLPEVDKRLEKGELFGEISMFSPTRRRTSTAICETNAVLLILSDNDMLRLYYQNPRFGFALVRLITRRLIENYTATAEQRSANVPPTVRPSAAIEERRHTPEPDRPAPVTSGRPARRALGPITLPVMAWSGAVILLIAYSTWALAPYVRSVLFRDAALTTWINVATAPIHGNLDGPLPAPGERVGPDGRLALIRNLQADSRGAAEAEAEVARAAAQVDELRTYLSSMQQLDDEWQERTSRYADTFKSNLTTEIEGAKRELEFISKRLALERAVAERKQTLSQRGDAAQSAVDESLAEVMELERQRAEREKVIAHSEERRKAAERGVFLAADGRNPDWAHHSYDRLRLELAQATRALAEAEAELAKARVAAAAGRDAFERISTSLVLAPAGSLVWSSIAGGGAAVEPGMPLAEWIDCSMMLVDVPAHDTEIGLLSPGMPAEVLIDGEDELRSGTILLTRGAASTLDDTDLAATAKGRSAGLGHVIVSLEPTPQDIQSCAIGAAAWVEFPQVSMLDVLRARLRL